MADINLNKTCDYYQSLRYTENYPITPACAQQGPAEDSNSGRHMLPPCPQIQWGLPIPRTQCSPLLSLAAASFLAAILASSSSAS
jgi:uncharacterized protein YbbK (DUF523 family)